MKRTLPKNTDLTYFVLIKNHIFGITRLGANKYILKIVHCWEDGEIMNFGWKEENDDKTYFPTEQAPNPRHIVRLFGFNPSKASIYKAVNEFLPKYYPNQNSCSEVLK